MPRTTSQHSATPARKIPVCRRINRLRKETAVWRQAGETIALVPTMGALHEGHLRLVKLAAAKADRLVVSIFVNPAQFAPHEDLDRYPRDEAADLARLADLGVARGGSLGVDLVWAPHAEDVYPDGFATEVAPGGAALGLETDYRPHFFTGVATVCTKLFNQVQPDIAVFGEKDYQQLQVIKQIVRDLNMPLKIIGGATQREKDGLALSSRNKYLTEAERAIAPLLNEQIKQVAAKVAGGGRIGTATNAARKALADAGFTVDYVEVRDTVTLAPASNAKSGKRLRVLAAATLGKTRLIDNCAVK